MLSRAWNKTGNDGKILGMLRGGMDFLISCCSSTGWHMQAAIVSWKRNWGSFQKGRLWSHSQTCRYREHTACAGWFVGLAKRWVCSQAFGCCRLAEMLRGSAGLAVQPGKSTGSCKHTASSDTQALRECTGLLHWLPSLINQNSIFIWEVHGSSWSQQNYLKNIPYVLCTGQRRSLKLVQAYFWICFILCSCDQKLASSVTPKRMFTP